MVARIELSNGGFARVDDADYEWLRRYKWCNNGAGAATARVNGEVERMHRLLLDAPPGVEVDHIDHDRLNNQRENLRLATRQQNSFNSSKRSDNTSGYKGVSWHRQEERWQGYIYINKRRRSLGLFDSAEAAAVAYDLAAVEMFGAFANTNFAKADLDAKRDRFNDALKPRPQPTSKYRGVSWSRASKKWVARIQRDGKPAYLGSYESEEEAAKSYEAAKLNFPKV